MKKHTFDANVSWVGNLAGSGQLKAGSVSSEVSVPDIMGGKGVGTNPEELLVAAAASCYAITLSAMLQFQGISTECINVKSVAHFEEEMGPQLRSVEHSVEVTMSENIDKSIVERMIKQAEGACMVSHALKGNVSVSAVGSFHVG